MAEELVADRLQSNLTRLRLPRISEILLDIVETGKAQGYSHLQVLDALLEEEVACKEQRRLDTALKVSGLPFIKTLDDFDFTFQPNLDRRQVNALFDLTFLAKKENVVLLGPPGVGKTHLAVALAVKASQAGQSIFFTSMADLIDKLKADHGAGKTGRLRGHYRAAVVVVDEVGYTPITQDECNLFYRFVATRYEKASTIITSNKAFVDWQEMFHDAIIVTAILDRLLHHCTVVNIRGHSYRLKGKVASDASRDESAGLPLVPDGHRIHPCDASHDASVGPAAPEPEPSPIGIRAGGSMPDGVGQTKGE